MPLEIRELTIRAVVSEKQGNCDGDEKSDGEAGGSGQTDQKRILDLAMEQVVKMMKNKDER